MGISFSGLASGLDTSSWVESLTALKRAKIKTLEEEKSTVQLTKETLDNIKSFFSSFRSMLEKVTDTRFGVAAMDIFSKNLANSSDTNLLTAIATNEAAEGTYNVTVDKLATQTEAVSCFKRSVTETVTAGLDTKLTAIGANINPDVGSAISINVNGANYGIELNKDDTIATFINKLKDKGVEASYNTNTGIFSANISRSDITENGTNIANALHLADVNEGYKSGSVLQTKTTEEAYYKNASSDTKLTTLGVTAGQLKIGSSTFTINANTSIGNLIEDLGSQGISASFADGRLTIDDAVINTSNATGSSFINALNLTQSVYSKAQISKVLTYQEDVNTVHTADGNTKLSEFGTITNGSTITVKNAAGADKVINLNENSTINDLFNALNTQAGMSGSIVNGQIQITGGTITGGTYDVITNLGLSRTPNATSMSGNMLTTNITTTEAASGSTLLKDIGVETGTVTFETASGNKNITINNSTTIDSFVAALNTNGITASFVDGNLSIKDAVIKTSTGKGASLISNLNLSASTNTTTQTSNALSYNATIETNYEATGGTYLRDVGAFSAGQTILVKDASGSAHTITLSNANSTIQTMIDGFEAAGMHASITNGVLEISGGTITGGTYDISNIFNLTDVTDATSTTGAVCSTDITVKQNADGSTKLSALGVSTGNATFRTTSGNQVVAITANTTIDDLVSALDTAGIDASFNNGTFTINNTTIDTSSGIGASLVNGLGLTTFVNSSEQSSQSLSYEAGINTTTAASSNTKLSAIGENPNGKTVTIEGSTGQTKTITLNTNSTIGNLLSEMNGFDGMTASIDGNGNISVTGGTITGGTYDAVGILGLTRTADATNMVGNSLTISVETEHIANGNTLLSDLGVTEGQYSVSTYIGDYTFNITAGKTINDLIADINSTSDATASISSDGVLTIMGGCISTDVNGSNIQSILGGSEIIIGSNTVSNPLRYTTIEEHIMTLDDIIGDSDTYLANEAPNPGDTVGEFVDYLNNWINEMGGHDAEAIYDETNGQIIFKLNEYHSSGFLQDMYYDLNIPHLYQDIDETMHIENTTYTSSALHVGNSATVAATTSTVLKDSNGNAFNLRNIGLTFTSTNVDDNGNPLGVVPSPVQYSSVMPSKSEYTIQDLLDFVNNKTSGSATYENGVLTINGGTISTTNGALESVLGLSTSTTSSSITSSGVVTYQADSYNGIDVQNIDIGLDFSMRVGQACSSVSSIMEPTLLTRVRNDSVKLSQIVSSGKTYCRMSDVPVARISDLSWLPDGIAIEIADEADLLALRDAIDSGNWNASGTKFIQTSDITLTDSQGFCIGASGASGAFMGRYDGGGHTITIDSDSLTEDAIGNARFSLFGYTNFATIENVNLNIDVRYSSECSESYIGALVNVAENSTISNISITGYMEFGSVGDIGGLAGHTYGCTLDNIYTNISMECSGSSIGGLVGSASGTATISKVYSESRLYVSSYAEKGGIVGSVLDSMGGTSNTVTFRDILVNGEIYYATYGSPNMVGDIVGEANDPMNTIFDHCICTATGDYGPLRNYIGNGPVDSSRVELYATCGESISDLTSWGNEYLANHGWAYDTSTNEISRAICNDYDLVVSTVGANGIEYNVVSFDPNSTFSDVLEANGYTTGIYDPSTGDCMFNLTVNNSEILSLGLGQRIGIASDGSSVETLFAWEDMTWFEAAEKFHFSFGDTEVFEVVNDKTGVTQTISATPDTCIKDTLDAISAAGIDYTINYDGTVSFTPRDTHNALIIPNSIITTNTPAYTEQSTTLQDLFEVEGGVGTGQFSITIGDSQGNETVINLNSNDAFGPGLGGDLESYEIYFYLDNKKLSIENTGEYYIKSMSEDLETALNFSAGEGLTYSVQQSENTITSSTALGDIGVTDGVLVIGTNGGENTSIVIDSTDTIAQFGAKLEAAGYDWSLDEGRFTINSRGDHYIHHSSSSNIAEKLKLYYNNWEQKGAVQTSQPLTDTQASYSTAGWDTKLVDLKNGSNTSLGITTGTLNVSVDGNQIGGDITITNNTTLGDLRDELADRGINLKRNTSTGELSLTADGDVSFGGTSNVKTELFSQKVHDWVGESTVLYYNNSISHIIDEQSDVRIVHLKNTSGQLLNIQTGDYYVVKDGIRKTETITDNTTVADFIETMQGYGFNASVDANGQIRIAANGNSYLESADNGTNFINKMIRQTTTKNVTEPLRYTTNSNQAITNDTLIKDITGASLTGGVFNITDANGNIEATVNVDNNTTVQDIREALGLRGFTTSLINGQLSVHSDSGKQLKSTGGGTNALSILGIETANATSHYNTSNPITITTSTPETTGATLSTALSDLGVTQGEFYIYSNGVQNKVYVGEGETVESLLNKFTTFGVSASLVDDGGNKYIRIAGNGYCGAAASDAAGASNIVSQLFGANQIITSNGMRNNSAISYDETTTQCITADTKISDIKNSTLQAGNFNVVDSDGTTTHAVSINNSTTVGELMDTLSTLYGFNCSLAGGQVTVQSNDGKSLASIGGGTNALSILGIETNGTTKTYESTPINVVEHSNEITKATIDTELSNLGVTSGQFNVYVDGVKNVTYVSEGETVGSLLNKLQGLGVQAGLVSDGANNVIKILGNGNTRIETSAEAGASNIVSTLFNPSNIVTTTKYNNSNPITYDVTTGQAVTRDTKIKDIADSSLATGNFNIVDPDGTVHAIAVDNNTTIGSLMDVLSSGAYGFDTTLTSSGQLLVHSSDGKALKSIGGGTNALSILGIETTSVTSTYDSTPLSYTSSNNETFKPTLDTDLSTLGITSGEFYVYSNGVKNTAYVSTGDKVRDLLDTIKTFGIQAALVEEGGNTIIKLNGNGDSYVAASDAVTGQKSNVVQTLFTNPATETYSYSGIPQELVPENIVVNNATSDSLIGDIAKAAGLNANAADGIIKVNVNGVESSINIASTDTVENVLDRFRQLGLEATIGDGKITIASGYNTLSIDQANSTSLFGKSGNSLSLAYNENLGGYTQSNATIDHEVTRIDDISVSNYANRDTKLSLLNISDGSLTVYRDGEKKILEINSDWTLAGLQSAINSEFGANGDIVINFDDENGGIIKNGFMEFSSTSGARVEIGSTTDKSNFSSITGVQSQDDGTVRSARELYCVTSSSKVTQEGLFRGLNNLGKESSVTVTAGTFRVGDAEFTIDENTTIADIASMINNSNDAQATAWWDNITGQFFIRAKSTGASFINIEAGTSNFTDIMGLTKDGRMVVDSQKIGNNAKFTINGTSYTSTSNTVDSSVSRIQGVTLSLKGMSEGSSVTLTIEKDKESVANAISDVVDAYNELMNNVDKQIATTGKLNKETTLKSLRNQLRNLMTGSVGSSPYTTLSKLGISFASASAGNINTDNASINNFTFDKDEFLKAYATDPSAVKALLVGDDVNKGIFTQVEDLVENALKGATGYFDTAAKSYTSKITNLETKITNQSSYLERYKSRLETKFKSMDMLISKMNDQYRSFMAA